LIVWFPVVQGPFHAVVMVVSVGGTELEVHIYVSAHVFQDQICNNYITMHRVKNVHLKNCINESAMIKFMYSNTLNSWKCVYTSDTLDQG